MFDDNQPKPSVNSAPQPTANQPGKEEIHTMPMEYYLGNKTAEATGVVQPAKVAATQVTNGGKKKLMNIGIMAIIVIILGVSGWLLYKSYEKPVVPPTNTAIVQPSTAETDGKGAVTEPIVTAETGTKEEPIKKAEPVKFSPDKIRKDFIFSLSKWSDQDKDGMTDEEEETIFGTNKSLNDSDNDLYKDHEEVVHLYSPVDVGPVRLWQKDFAEYYTNKAFGYKFIYPKVWLVAPLDPAKPSDLMITSNENEFVNIMVFDKPAGQKIEDWYLSLAPTVKKAELKSYETYSKIKVLESPDELTVYIDEMLKLWRSIIISA